MPYVVDNYIQSGTKLEKIVNAVKKKEHEVGCQLCLNQKIDVKNYECFRKFTVIVYFSTNL